MEIGIDWRVFPLVLGFIILWLVLDLLYRRSRPPTVPVTTLSFLKHFSECLRATLGHWPRYLLVLALALFSVAVLDPRLYIKKRDEVYPLNRSISPVEGIAIYFILDQSGSMAEKALVYSAQGRVSETKLDLLKQATQAFIQGDALAGLSGRPNDMIGLVAFARTAQVLAPLTLDHRVLLDELDKLSVMRIKDQDGTGIGYAIYKAANLIAATRHYAEDLRGEGKPAYDIKDAVMILVTDGMQDPNPLDQDNRFRWMDPEQAAAFAREQKIRLYVINIDPEFSKPEWEANRRQMQRVAETTGGRFYSLNTTSNISQIYKEIDSLVKSTIPMSLNPADRHGGKYKNIPLYPFLIAAGMVCFALAVVMQTTWLRVFP